MLEVVACRGWRRLLTWRFGPARKRAEIFTDGWIIIKQVVNRDPTLAGHVRPGTHIHFYLYRPGHVSARWSTWCIITTAQSQARVPPLALALLGSRFVVCPLFAAARRVFKGSLG